MPDQGITLVIADDHPIFRKGLRDILEEEPDFRIVAECADGEEALRMIRKRDPDLAILDLEMPGMNGLDIAAVLHRDHISTGVIILTVSDRIEIFNKAMEYGVGGYILKDTAATDLVEGIHTVLRGSYFFSPSIATRVLSERARVAESPHMQSSLDSLTATERKILHFIAEDKSSSEIADILHISTRTVETHRSNITEKLDLHGSYALVRFALLNRNIL